MQLVPIIPQQTIGVEESLTVTGIAAVKTAKPVEERTLPPLVTHRHELPLHTPGGVYQQEKRQVRQQVRQQGERRLMCRRIQHLPVLEELRSAIDRRRLKQRGTDLQLHIDEEV